MSHVKLALLYAVVALTFSLQNAEYPVADNQEIFVSDDISWVYISNTLAPAELENVLIAPLAIKLSLVLLTETEEDSFDTVLINTISSIKNSYIRSYFESVLFQDTHPYNGTYYTIHSQSRLYVNDDKRQIFGYQEEQIFQTYYSGHIENMPHDKQTLQNANDWWIQLELNKTQNKLSMEHFQKYDLVFVHLFNINITLTGEFCNMHYHYFYISPIKKIYVKYIDLTQDIDYFDSQTLDAKILRISLKENINLFIFLPHAKFGIYELVQTLNNHHIKHVQWMMKRVKARLRLPFIEYAYSDNLRDIFDEYGFGKITPNIDVNKVEALNKVKINIQPSYTSQKTTGAKMIHKNHDYIEDFYVDRPFVYLIEDGSNNNLLFAGSVFNPLTFPN